MTMIQFLARFAVIFFAVAAVTFPLWLSWIADKISDITGREYI